MNHCYEPDREFDSMVHGIICNTCVHKQSGITCVAFPDGIPQYILRSSEHYLPVPGDNGITYTPKT